MHTCICKSHTKHTLFIGRFCCDKIMQIFIEYALQSNGWENVYGLSDYGMSHPCVGSVYLFYSKNIAI